MSRISPKGAELGQVSEFFPLMNRKYQTRATIAVSKQALVDAGVDMTQMEYGEYQDVIVRPQDWPGDTLYHWRGIVLRVRKNLRAQENGDQVAPDDGTVPPNRWELLNAAIRRCFNNSPEPITFEIDPRSQDPGSDDANTHTIRLNWTGNPPTHLVVSMICPYDTGLPKRR
jgi:hypothetical protein